MKMKIQFKLTAFLLILSVLLSIICMPIAAENADPAATGTDTDASLSDPSALYPEPIETEDQIFERLTADSFMLNYIDETTFRAAGHINRLPEEEDLNSYVFENEDGTRTAYILNEPVKYIDSTGAMREKDLTLMRGQMGNASVMATGVNTEAYTITATNTPMTFPGDLTHGVHFTYGDYTITLRPETVNPSTEVLQAEGKVLYRNAFGSTAHLMYTPQLNGLKEDIVLTRYSTQNTFTFILNTDGMSVARDAGGYYLYDGIDEEAKLRLGQVISYDANGDFSIGEMTVTHQSGNTYQVTLTVDPDFLENAFYPVTVDPTLKVSDALTGENSIEDIVVFEGAPNTCYSSMQYNTVGYSSSLGRGRTVFRLSGLYNSSVFQSIAYPNSVKFYVYDYSSVAQTIALHPLENTSWNENTATWNNIGSYTTNTIYSKTNVQLPVNSWAEFDITLLVDAWKSGNANYPKEAGFILVSHNETVSKKIYSSENTNTQRRPYVQLNYSYSISAPSAFAVAIGQTKEIPVSIYPSSYTVEWTTENASVATIDQAGNVVGVTLGVTNLNGVITFTDDGTTANCSIEVHVILLAEQQYFLQNKSTVYVEPNDINDPNYNQITEKFVEITGTSAGSAVVQRYWGGDRNQRWDVTYDVNYECYKFKSVEAGKYLGNDNGSIVLLAGTFDSRWLIAQTSDGNYTIKHSTHKNSTLVLAVEDIAEDENNSNNTSNRDNLIFKIFETDNSSHEWIFHPVFINLPTVPDDPDNPDLNGEIPYQPELWNDGGEIQGRTNCYAYALNTQVKPDFVGVNDSTEGIGYVIYPGLSSDYYSNPLGGVCQEDGKEIIKRVMADKDAYNFTFRKIGRYDVCSPGCYKVVLVIYAQNDYHWYRQNPDGTWSHKQGPDEVQQLYADPLITDRKNYTDFIGYFEMSPLNTMAQ